MGDENEYNASKTHVYLNEDGKNTHKHTHTHTIETDAHAFNNNGCIVTLKKSDVLCK